MAGMAAAWAAHHERATDQGAAERAEIRVVNRCGCSQPYGQVVALGGAGVVAALLRCWHGASGARRWGKGARSARKRPEQ
jgi:hypothetical protein